VRSWDWPQATIASSWTQPSLPLQGRDQLYCLAVGRRWLLSGARNGETHVLRLDDGKLQATWAGPDVPIRSVAISACEDWAAVGAQDGLVRIMSLPEGKVLGTCHDHTGSVDGLAIDPSDKFLVSCSTDNRVQLYQLQSGLPQLFATLTVPTGPVRGLCFHPQRQQVALIAGPETAVRFWDLDRLQERFGELGLR
jgi:WD40 repeat protein